MTAFNVALMVLVPVAATAVAMPPVVMVATEVVAEAQVTVAVMFCGVVSLKVPVAVNCCEVPLGTVGLAGVTAIDTRVGEVAVSTVEPTMEFNVALMVLVPVAATAVAKPVLVMVATAVVADAHVTVLEIFWVLLSL